MDQEVATHLSSCSQCEHSVHRVTVCRLYMEQILLLYSYQGLGAELGSKSQTGEVEKVKRVIFLQIKDFSN